LKDEAFQYWKSVFPHTYRAIIVISFLFSFKFVRMFYSRFFGLDYFCCGFTYHGTFLYPINVTSLVNIIVCMLPICVISIAGILAASWGTQFYITCIEAMLFLIAFIIITIIEFKTAKMHNYNKILDPDFDNVNAMPTEQEIEKRLRREALKGIVNRMFGGDKMFDNHKIEDCVKNQRDWVHDRYSLPDRDRNIDSDEESDMTVYPHSYPISPRTRAKIEEPMFPLTAGPRPIDRFPDNVY
jgi:hypothetical protein